MAEIVNLRSVRKAKARNTAATTADANRAAFGRSKASRHASSSDTARLAKTLDDAKLDR